MVTLPSLNLSWVLFGLRPSHAATLRHWCRRSQDAWHWLIQYLGNLFWEYSGYVSFFMGSLSKSKQLLQKSTDLSGNLFCLCSDVFISRAHWFWALGGTTPRTAKHSGCPEALAHVAGAATPIHWPRLRRQDQCGRGWVLKYLCQTVHDKSPFQGFNLAWRPNQAKVTSY